MGGSQYKSGHSVNKPGANSLILTDTLYCKEATSYFKIYNRV